MAVFEVDEKSYISRLWFIAGQGRDWLGMLYKKDASDPKWTFRYRFRYYKPDPYNDPFTDNDEKSVFSASGEDKDKLLEALPTLFKMLELEYRSKMEVMIVEGDLPAFIETMKKENKPWMHIRTMQ